MRALCVFCDIIKHAMPKRQRKKLSTKIIERVTILLVALCVIGLLVFFMSTVFFPFIKLEIAQDFDGAKALLAEKGFLGFATVSLIEALQMVVIFIPAEFIQLTSGMSYPWWLAIILCDIGVIIGSSIIYLLVNLFNFSGNTFNRSNRIERYVRMSKNKSTIILMYLLFIMPIIPFGAICYFGSSKKVPFHKYLLTCATGVIPSICTSILMGTAVKEFITRAMPVWLLILIIFVAGAILFTLLLFVLNKFFFKQNANTPFSPFYGIIVSLCSLFMRFRVRYNVINRHAIDKLDDSYLVLANHHAWFDFLGIHYINKNRRYAMVMNNYYFNLPIIGKWFKRAGCIPKKLFTPDINCVIDIFKAKEAGFPIAMFPEARLSTDGGRSLMNPGIVPLIKKLNVPVVLVQLRRGYFIKPKWRKKRFTGRYDVKVARVVQPEELAQMSDKEILDVVESNLYFNEFDNTKGVNIIRPHKAEGLEKILYRCPHCGGMFTNISKGNKMTCTACGKEYEIKPNYQFKKVEQGDYNNLYDYYQAIRAIETKELDNVYFLIDVNVKIFTDGKTKPRLDKGTFRFTNKKVSYKSIVNDTYFEYRIDQLEGIAYSVNEEFEMYYKGELYYFYPTKVDKAICTRIALIFELMKEKEEYQRRNQIAL